MPDPLKPSSLKTSAFVPNMDHLAQENFYLKVADTEEELAAAQHLRYKIFYDELGAIPDAAMRKDQRDYQDYDAYCDHLLVIDKNAPKGQHIIGTYRISIPEILQEQNISLYTETEFDLSKLRATRGRIMEVSRSCILEPYRNKMVINLLWKGIATYVFRNKVDYLIGTPSFYGTDLAVHQEALGYLNAYHLADETFRPRVLEQFYHPLPVIDKESVDARRVFMKLPSLLKGYLRTGALIGDGAFIDHQFNCIDLVIVMPMDAMNKYLNHYKRTDAE